jgi:hypothetical protein
VDGSVPINRSVTVKDKINTIEIHSHFQLANFFIPNPTEMVMAMASEIIAVMEKVKKRAERMNE